MNTFQLVMIRNFHGNVIWSFALQSIPPSISRPNFGRKLPWDFGSYFPCFRRKKPRHAPKSQSVATRYQLWFVKKDVWPHPPPSISDAIKNTSNSRFHALANKLQKYLDDLPTDDQNPVNAHELAGHIEGMLTLLDKQKADMDESELWTFVRLRQAFLYALAQKIDSIAISIDKNPRGITPEVVKNSSSKYLSSTNYKASTFVHGTLTTLIVSSSAIFQANSKTKWKLADFPSWRRLGFGFWLPPFATLAPIAIRLFAF